MIVQPKIEDGFTLVEVLIAMFIFSLISAGTLTALTGSLRGKAQMEERLTVISRIDSARALMKSDFSSISLLPGRDAYGGEQLYVLSGGIDNLITFTRSGRTNPGGLEPRSEFQRVTYIFENGRLIRRAPIHANPAPQTGTTERVLLEGLSDIKITFHHADSVALALENGGASTEQRVKLYTHAPQNHTLVASGQTENLPAIVTVQAEFENGDTLVQHFETGL